MSDKPEQGIDRRDLIMASMATAAAATALAANAGPARAQDAKGASSGTVYTGEVIQEIKVVSTLDVNDLEPGRKHFLYFRGVQMRTGQHWHVSVTVARGAKPGKRIVLTSGVHGDEMSSIQTVLTVMDRLDPAQMSGTVMAVTDISRPALEGIQRKWPNSSRSIGLVDMNREWPGSENGHAPGRHAALLFNRLLRPNADAAIDFHTGTTGFELSAFNIGDTGRPEIKAMLDLYPVGQIMHMPAAAYPTTLHNALLIAGIPAICPEVGSARILAPEIIAQFVEGTMNVLKHYGVVTGPMGRTGKDMDVFTGHGAAAIGATAGGLVEYLVKLNDKVEAGQKIAIQRNSFGKVVADYASPAAGQVAGRRSDALAEPGDNLMMILLDKAGPADDGTYQE